MTARDLKKTETRWDQSGFAALKATWSAERIKKDKTRLKSIFNMAAHSPTLKQALAWAEAHGVQFFVDHQSVNCGGYYTPGTGVVAIADRYTSASSIAYAVQVITHEIRHAWQDYHGLCPTDFPGPVTTPDFAAYFIQLSLIEADATAFGKRAEGEFLAAKLKKENIPLSLCFQAALADEKADLRKKFLDWSSTPKTTRYYGDAASKHYGRAAGIYKGLQPPRNLEFISEALPLGPGPDITDSQRLLELGKTFSGWNYLAKFPKDILLKKILSPSMALSFYRAANDDQKQLTAAIRKNCLRQKFLPHP